MKPASLAYEFLTSPRVLHATRPLADREDIRLGDYWSAITDATADALQHVPLHQVEAALDVLKAGGGTPVLVCLETLAREYLCWMRARIRFRQDRFLQFREQVSATLSVDLLWTTALALECLEGESGDLRPLESADLRQILREPVEPELSLMMMDGLKARGLPELHRHASLSRLPELLWVDLLQLRLDGVRQSGYSSHRAESLRALLAHMRWARTARRGMLRWLQGEDPSRPFEQVEDHDALDSQMLELACTPRSLVGRERALVLLSLRALKGEGRTCPTWLAPTLHNYLLIRAVVQRELVQPSQGIKGLDRFRTQYVDSYLHNINSKDSPEHPDSALTQAWRTGGVRWLEWRCPPRTPLNKLEEIAQQVISTRQPADRGFGEPEIPPLTPLREPDQSHASPGVRVIFHFLRQKDETPPSPDLPGLWSRHRTTAAQVRTQAEACWTALSESRFADMLVGLDVANVETYTPTEVFAPWIRALRSTANTHQLVQRGTPDRGVGLGVTIHAGEEFHHLLEGMRAIDEAVRFVGLEPGDRIGHGLALGLQPADWARRHEDCVLQPRLARLDDLVWALPRLARLGFGALSMRAEEEIEELSTQIYGHRHIATELHRAWRLRALAAPSIEGDVCVTPLSRFVRRQFDERIREASPECIKLWRAYWTSCRVHECGCEHIEVELDPQWHDAMYQIQEQLLHELAERGIAIEVNPSSNVAVGPIGRYVDHPIFRWSPPGAPSSSTYPTIIVGSDDPTIFGNELYHEYGALACAAIARGTHPDEAMLWLHRLRENGLRYLFTGTTSPT